MHSNISELKEKVLAGGELTEAEAMGLATIDEAGIDELIEAAAEVTRRFFNREFDSCSIINARSGRCPENCKWCAQSAHYKTSASVYPLVDRKTCMDAADMNRRHGIRRFSLVTSGRAITGKDLDTACSYFEQLREEGGLHLCASMGLLDRESLEKLYKAGCTRYHCNLETAPSHFPALCSTHSLDDKLKTIRMARAVGMEVCSGGIIGMGETREQRIEFALALREIAPDSIPVNVLQPIPGTPLQDSEPLSQREILLTVAIFRMIHPRAVLRFAGGRARMSRDTQRRAMEIAVNGAIMGDMLTTIGSQVADDKKLIAECGYDF